jgi:dsRNA-specific ribonuclease
MIYLDGSRFFFDIEGCFSNLCEKAMEENKDSEADENAKELCKGFAKFFGTKPEFVRAGKDYKTVLQEKLQIHGEVLIKYNIINETGPDHDKTFTAEVECDGKKLASGTGRSKKAAEMEAARKAIELLD